MRGLNVDVYLAVPGPEPEAAALAQRFGLLDFRQPQHAAVERAACAAASGWTVICT